MTTSLEMRTAEVMARRRRSRRCGLAVQTLIALLVLWSLTAIIVGDTDWTRISPGSVGRAIGRFTAFDWRLVPDLLAPALETVVMATLATLLGLVLAIPVAWLGAGNISPLGRFTYAIGRALMTLSRSIHEIVWGLVFVAAVGLGALAGILAMSLRSIGFISKMVAEAIEDVDTGPIEAVRAAGANRFQILMFAILPQVLPVVLGSIIFEWDVNIRRSTIMGLVGAGGLGLALHRQITAYNYGGIVAVILTILGIILIGEVSSTHARKAVI